MILLVLTGACLLTGCGGSGETQDFALWQQELAGGEKISFTAEIAAVWEDGGTSYAARVERTGEETVTTVTAPETIAGISFRSRDGAGTLEYDSLVLELAPGEAVISPCAAGSILLDALCRGNLLYTGTEGELTTAAIDAPGGETVNLWRDEDGVPIYAEIGREGTTELILSIDDWKIGE